MAVVHAVDPSVVGASEAVTRRVAEARMRQALTPFLVVKVTPSASLRRMRRLEMPTRWV